MIDRLARVLCCTLGIWLSLLAPTEVPAEVRTVALSGDMVAGSAPLAEFARFASPAISDRGEALFWAELSRDGGGEAEYSGIWREENEQMKLVAQSGVTAPGAPNGIPFEFFGITTTNAMGHVSFLGFLPPDEVPAGSMNRGIWSISTGTLEMVAGPGMLAPGAAEGEQFVGFTSQAVLNARGETGFFATAFDPTGQTGFQGVWIGDANDLQLVARTEMQAPGIAAGHTFQSFDFRSAHAPVINLAGQTAFRAVLAGLEVSPPTRHGIWMGRAGEIELVARQGAIAPNIGAGAIVIDVGRGDVMLNAAGEVAFVGGLSDCGAGQACGAVLKSASGSLTLVAGEGIQAVGTPLGVTYSSFQENALAMNARGQVAFNSMLDGDGIDDSNDMGLWSEGLGELHLVARKGDPAPGTESGVVFAPQTSSSDFLIHSFALNRIGQTAFLASLTGTDINDSNDVGIWAEDRLGELKLVAREGQLLEVAPGDIRQIEDLNFNQTFSTGNGDGRTSNFNNQGQLAFAATFTDGSSGVFVTNTVAIPEPSSTMILLVLLAIATGNCRLYYKL